MFKFLSTITAIVILSFIICSTPVMSQSKEEGISLFNEANILQENAQSPEDMQKSAEKYHRALTIFEAAKYDEGIVRVTNNLGNVYSDWGRYDKAVDYYEKSLAICRGLKDRRGEAYSLGNLGNVYSKLGQHDKAVSNYEQLLALGPELNDLKIVAMALSNVSAIYLNWGRYDKAVEYSEKSLVAARELKDLKSEAATLNNLGEAYRERGEYEKAVEFYQKALEIARENKDTVLQSWTLNNLGIVYRHLAKYDMAVEHYEKALDIKRELNDRKGEGSTFNNLGAVYGDWGQYDKAVDCYKKSLIAAREFNDIKREANALNNLGGVYLLWGQYGTAIEHYERSFAICREINDLKGQSQILSNLGTVYSIWGHYLEAVAFYENSVSQFRECRDSQGQAYALNNLGLVYKDLGQYGRAIEHYKKSLTIYREISDLKGQGQVLNNLGEVYAAQGQYSKALTNFFKGPEIFKTIGVPSTLANYNIGNLYLSMGEIEKAEPFLEESHSGSTLGRLGLLKGDYALATKHYGTLLKSSEENRSVADLFTAYTGLGASYEATGDVKQAEECYLKAVNLTEDLRSSLPKAQREKFFDVRINGFLRTAPYDGLARARMKLNKPLEAFKVSEYTKSRIFAETMSKRSESSGVDVPAEVLKQDHELTDQFAALKKKRQEGYQKANQQIISVIEPQLQEMEKKFQDHVKRLREHYPLFAATKYPEPMNLTETELKPDEWVLAYHVTDSGIIIYLIKGKEIVKALFRPITKDNLDSLVLKFRKPLEITPGKDNLYERLTSFDLAAGKELSDLLLSDILESLPPNVPLLIVPDDSLGTLPFEMLVLNDKGFIVPSKTSTDFTYVSGAEFFGDRNPLCYSQSVTALTLARIHAKSKAKEVGLLVIADPVFRENDERVVGAPKKEAPTGPLASLCKSLGLMAAENDPQMGGLTFSRLSRTGELAKSVAALVKKNADVYTGFEATKSNFFAKIAPRLSHYDEVVFATHGYFGKDLPGIMEPVLVLTLVPPGTDGFLRMTEVMGLNMNADIVALTACQTGLGKRTAGEGTMGMGRAFQYAGAKSVLMSMWSVSEVTSVRLVKSIFQHMKDGKSKSESLALARDELRKSGFDHPFFWAGFILVGEAD